MLISLTEAAQQATASLWTVSSEAAEPLSFKIPCNHRYSKFFRRPARQTVGGIVGFVHDYAPYIIAVAAVVIIVLYIVARRVATKATANLLTGIAVAIIAGPLIAIGVASVDSSTGHC